MLNLLPKNEKINIKKDYIGRLALVYLGATFLVIVIAIFLILPNYFLSSIKYDTISQRAEIVKKGEISTDSAKFKVIIDDMNEKIKIVNTNNDNLLIRPDELINIAIRQINKKIKITGIFYDKLEDGKIMATLRGVSENREGLSVFVKNIEKEERLSANLPISNLVKNKDIIFSIQVTSPK